MVYKLTRSLYGLAQSPVLWYDTINAVMLTVGFTPTQSDPCVYTYGKDDTFTILTLYVHVMVLEAVHLLVDRKTKGNDVEHTDTISGCDTYSQQQFRVAVLGHRC